MKDFKKEFDKFKQMIQDGSNFAFARFSDGEMFIMQNQTVVLAPGYFVTGERIGHNIYTKEEQKTSDFCYTYIPMCINITASRIR